MLGDAAPAAPPEPPAATVTLTVIAVPDPGTSAAGAQVRVFAERTVAGTQRSGTIGADGRATFSLPRSPYTVTLAKTGFLPARGTASFARDNDRAVVRIALHAVPSAALRTIGSVSAAERGAFNGAPAPVAVVPREAYRDQGQPDLATVLTQTPSLTVDRAARGALPFADVPPVALVRGGTPLETQVLLEGVPIALPTTRTLALTSIPAFLINELEVDPGMAAPVPTIDGALNGTLNLRFPEPTPVWRALPELGADSPGGSFADFSAGGALAHGRIGIALAAASSGAKGQSDVFDAAQRALVVKARAALSPAATLTATTYDEKDETRSDTSLFGFTEAELRVNGARDVASARWWHASSLRQGPAAGDPFEFRTDDALSGASVELDRLAGRDTYSLGFTETYGLGSALGTTDVDPGAHTRVQTGFARALVHPLRNVETQLALYGARADLAANGRTMAEGGIAARLGLAFRPTSTFALRGSIGAGFTPPSLVAFASLNGRPGGATYANGADVGLDHRIFDRETTLSFDVFASTEQNRLVENRIGRWTDVGTVARRGAELSLARRPRAGLGYLLQAWTASETPALLRTEGDVASGATHGYAEISYHHASGSRVSLGATYWSADPLIAQPAVVLLNSNVEIQVGARGKLQFSLENLNDAARTVISPGLPFAAPASAFAPGPRTLRLLLRRSFGRSGADG